MKKYFPLIMWFLTVGIIGFMLCFAVWEDFMPLYMAVILVFAWNTLFVIIFRPLRFITAPTTSVIRFESGRIYFISEFKSREEAEQFASLWNVKLKDLA